MRMPSGSYRQIDVGCCFYKYDDGCRRITCEGLAGDDSSIALIYHRKEDYERHIDTFCCKHYTKCEIYRMLMENKYNDE